MPLSVPSIFLVFIFIFPSFIFYNGIPFFFLFHIVWVDFGDRRILLKEQLLFAKAVVVTLKFVFSIIIYSNILPLNVNLSPFLFLSIHCI